MRLIMPDGTELPIFLRDITRLNSNLIEIKLGPNSQGNVILAIEEDERKALVEWLSKIEERHSSTCRLELTTDDANELLEHLRYCETEETITIESAEFHQRVRTALAKMLGLDAEAVQRCI